ncbi:hypothetical protein AQF98_17370 [Pedobacter sp. Hv1]|nr:hypothetical protein AQF98_17370 [Pedobacter sp. Hv1]
MGISLIFNIIFINIILLINKLSGFNPFSTLNYCQIFNSELTTFLEKFLYFNFFFENIFSMEYSAPITTI